MTVRRDGGAPVSASTERLVASTAFIVDGKWWRSVYAEQRYEMCSKYCLVLQFGFPDIFHAVLQPGQPIHPQAASNFSFSDTRASVQ